MDTSLSPLQRDLIAMLDATGAAERDLFGEIDTAARETPGAIGEWSDLAALDDEVLSLA